MDPLFEPIAINGLEVKNRLFLTADTVILATGAESCNSLQPELEELGIAVVVVGDAAKVALAFDAVHSGYQAGRSI